MGSAINLDEIKRFEVTEVYAHPDAKVDIVLVHGLNGDPRKTWTANNGVFWPTQLLPVTLKSAKVRILVYGYNADVYAFGSRSASTDMIHEHAASFLSNLAMERKSEEASDHPIIFVAHSLGGILIKRALERSSDLTSKNADDDRSIFVSTYGIIFLGTPHTGADPAKWGLIFQSMVGALVPKKVIESEGQLVKTLQKNNETLQNINVHFLDIYQRFKICMVHEMEKTDLKGTKTLIVDQASAGPLLPDVTYFGIDATHSGICKFESKNSPGYLNVSTTIKSWAQECEPIIQSRLEMEKKQRRQIRQAQAAELLDLYPKSPISTVNNTPAPSTNNSTIIYPSTVSIEPDPSVKKENHEPAYFIKPPGFRPNSLFVGRSHELASLHKHLFDPKRRLDGTSAVLIQSMPGGGKTHLARQFVYNHRAEFPGGIFWIRAKSAAEMASGFWDIAREAALRERNKDRMKIVDQSRFKDPQQFIPMVKDWLNSRQDWLMVVDGIHFSDISNLQEYIPDSPNTSLIYTSTEKSASGDYHWMNPSILRLPLLSAREAQELFLLELDRTSPFSKDDLKWSMELVQAMGFLPVVLHIMAQRLKATDEPLGRFAKHYSSEAKLRGLDAYLAVVEQLNILGAHEALNLVYILSFFAGYVPVEMISLGLPALDRDVPVRASEPDSGRTLNNTFRMLNMFALIERNDRSSNTTDDSPTNSFHSSQSSRVSIPSKASREILLDAVDVLRLHSVVQGFFTDYLLGKGTLPLWLSRAVKVFCCSYDVASDRITRRTNKGLVADYRLYEIHGNRLQFHISKNVKKNPQLSRMEGMLGIRLTAIRTEIQLRTPSMERYQAFQTSIFDRTSSSSDTAPDTPADLRLNSARSTWGAGAEVSHSSTETPISVIQHDIGGVNVARPAPFNSRTQFPPLPVLDDPGYESDRESVAMTIQPSQRTIRNNPSRAPTQPIPPISSNPRHEEWETVTRRPKSIRDHRTTRGLESKRYTDTAGAFRAIAIDPRISHETAAGTFQAQGRGSRSRSRGRLSGRSSAEVALTQISKNSPPPVRGGGMVQDKRSTSQKPVDRDGRNDLTLPRPKLSAGMASYAAAAAGGLSTDTAPNFEPVPRPKTEPRDIPVNRYAVPASMPSSLATASLKKFALPEAERREFTPMPPYPPTPLPYPGDRPQFSSSSTTTYDHRGQDVQQLLSLDQIPPLNANPTENIESAIPRTYPLTSLPYESIASSPPKHSLQQDYSSWGSPSNLAIDNTDASNPILSISSPNICTNNEPYYPGRPELSGLPASVRSIYHDGYTSQPLTREHSDCSHDSHHSLSSDDYNRLKRMNEVNPQYQNNLPMGRNEQWRRGDRRIPSFAETEPLPQLPMFSPRIEMTSYKVARERERKRRIESERERGLLKQYPRLGFHRVGERLNEWAVLDGSADEDNPPPTARRLNPAAPSFAPSFMPSYSEPSALGYGNVIPVEVGFANSPRIPSPPPNSSFSNPSNTNSSYSSPLISQPHAPSPLNHSPLIPSSAPYPSVPAQQPTARSSAKSASGGTDMSRSGSGGVVIERPEIDELGRVGVGRAMIEFGDFLDKVDLEEPRERSRSGWVSRECGVERAEGLGIRDVESV